MLGFCTVGFSEESEQGIKSGPLGGIKLQRHRNMNKARRDLALHTTNETVSPTTVSNLSLKFRATLTVLVTPRMVAHNDNHNIERTGWDGGQFKSNMFCTGLSPHHQMNTDYGQNGDCHVVQLLGLPWIKHGEWKRIRGLWNLRRQLLY